MTFGTSVSMNIPLMNLIAISIIITPRGVATLLKNCQEETFLQRTGCINTTKCRNYNEYFCIGTAAFEVYLPQTCTDLPPFTSRASPFRAASWA